MTGLSAFNHFYPLSGHHISPFVVFIGCAAPVSPDIALVYVMVIRDRDGGDDLW